MPVPHAAFAHDDDSPARLEALAGLSQRLLDRCRAAGASQAEVSCSEDAGLNVNVRMGEVETVESTRDRGIAVTVYFGTRKGSASTADLRDDRRFSAAASQMRRTLDASLASPPINCGTLGTATRDIGNACRACHQDFRG